MDNLQVNIEGRSREELLKNAFTGELLETAIWEVCFNRDQKDRIGRKFRLETITPNLLASVYAVVSEFICIFSPV